MSGFKVVLMKIIMINIGCIFWVSVDVDVVVFKLFVMV